MYFYQAEMHRRGGFEGRPLISTPKWLSTVVAAVALWMMEIDAVPSPFCALFNTPP